MTLTPTRAAKAPVLALLTVLALTACADGDDPFGPGVDDTVLTETALDAAATDVDTAQESLFAEAQRTRERERERGRDRPRIDRVGLAVEFGGAAVDLATEILAREGADERQRALLEEAQKHQRAAEAALDQGDTGAALRSARAACWTALKAWIAPGGITRDEAEKVKDTAKDLLTRAADAVGDDDGVRGLILSWAVQFYTHGSESLAAGEIRGVGALWKAAVLASFLLG